MAAVSRSRELVVGSLFTGYGGLDLGLGLVASTRTAWVCDIEPGPKKVLDTRFPGIPNHGDIQTVDWSQVEPVDVIVGGTPCQDLSTAGNRAGLRDGTRSGLWASMAHAIEALQPALVVWENVSGARSAYAYSTEDIYGFPVPGWPGGWGGVYLDRKVEEHLPGSAHDRHDHAGIPGPGPVAGGARGDHLHAPGCDGEVGGSTSVAYRRGLSQARAFGAGAVFEAEATAVPSGPSRRGVSGRSAKACERDSHLDSGDEAVVRDCLRADEDDEQERASRGDGSGIAGARQAVGSLESGQGRVGVASGGPVLRAIGRVVGDLASLGYDAQWTTLAASDVGAPHQRRRVFLLAHPQGEPWSIDDGDDAGAPFSQGIVGERAWGPWGGRTGSTDGCQPPVTRLLPTPAVNDMGTSYTPDEFDEWAACQRSSSGQRAVHGRSLSVEARRSRRDWGPYAAAIERWETVMAPAPAATEPAPRGGERLDPRFVEWMMGLPQGWVTGVPSVTRSAALRMLGNGVVPQQAAAAISMLARWTQVGS